MPGQQNPLLPALSAADPMGLDTTVAQPACMGIYVCLILLSFWCSRVSLKGLKLVWNNGVLAIGLPNCVYGIIIYKCE